MQIVNGSRSQMTASAATRTYRSFNVFFVFFFFVCEFFILLNFLRKPENEVRRQIKKPAATSSERMPNNS